MIAAASFQTHNSQTVYNTEYLIILILLSSVRKNNNYDAALVIMIRNRIVKVPYLYFVGLHCLIQKFFYEETEPAQNCKF